MCHGGASVGWRQHAIPNENGGPWPAAVVAVAVVVVLLYRRGRRTASGLAALALVLLLAAMVITLTINVPIDGQIAAWRVSTLPADWQAIRDRWEFFHGLRTALSVAGLASLFASALWQDS